MANFFKKLWKDEDGIGTLEIILIIAIIVIIVLLFKEKIVKWVEDLLRSSDTKIKTIDK
ncbi:hypothetical protein MH117_17225 [Paenibacillus sp. ACRRX]|uniref:Flp1 family type IVb pilin n=1 Tax=unclassified Paenibacillus TaxID=185978 RepID=UPI001EF68A62|nr:MULTISPECIES: Flp1 family type IVb pilin [unclassified Paenibacillus]MCG7409161.1 hypothetical protein [Paenibacillus sp. ACRRX]MDK8181845.1 Flp1 family type IVb pilin [Paenibacillus sp. UMB4589-SE434]